MDKRRGISKCHLGHAINFRFSMGMQLSPQESMTVLILTFEFDLAEVLDL